MFVTLRSTSYRSLVQCMITLATCFLQGSEINHQEGICRNGLGDLLGKGRMTHCIFAWCMLAPQSHCKYYEKIMNESKI